MNRSQSNLWFFVAIIFALLTTVLLLSYNVTDPANVMNELGGDTGKNYYTFIYHAIFGKGIWFDGMNYPYGEHIIYADGQPILSIFLHLFQPLTAHQALAIMNLCISFSYVLAIVFTWKILKYFGVRPILAVLMSCLIIVLDPQVMRVRSHFGLAYACNIPMLFYWSILFHNSGKWKYPIYILIMGAIMSLLHLYQGALIFIWIAFYCTWYVLLIKKPLKQKLLHVSPILLAAGLLFAYIKIFIALTDPVTDRPGFPLNTLESVTHIRDIITSPNSPFWSLIHNLTGFSRISDGLEGYTYLGISAIVVVLISVVFGVFYTIKKSGDKHFTVSEQSFSRVWLFMAISALLLAMGAPFIWHMQWLLNYLSLFKQFRAMGRFSWLFYYVITIYAALVINYWYSRLLLQKRAFIANSLLILVLFVWVVDAGGMVNYTRGFIATGRHTADDFFNKNEMKWNEYLESMHYRPTDFQGILLVPIFVSGSEKLWVGGDPSWSMSYGIRAATQLHLPIVDVQMSRTSWGITEKQVKTAAGEYAEKPMLNDLKSNKPFLIIRFEDSKVSIDEDYLIENSTFIGRKFHCLLYVCYPDKIKAADESNKLKMESLANTMQGTDTCINNTGPYYINHLDNKKQVVNFFGNGAMSRINGDDSVIAEIPFTPEEDNQLYEFSCWFLLDDNDYRSPYMNLKLFDAKGVEVSFVDALANASIDNCGMWFRASVYHRISSRVRTIKFILNNRPNPSYLLMDEMMLRPARSIIVSKAGDGKVMVNNHLLRNSSWQKSLNP